jgi:acyl-CoA reductase-like NAD-dependent aldehyde dehydrogenase
VPMSTTPLLPPSSPFVANAFIEPSGPREEVIVNPATEEVLGRVASAGERDVSDDPARAFALACRLRTGSVDINGGPGYTSPEVPFGGYKRSGVGRENGPQGIDEYTQFKTIKYHAR